jgi:tripartite-type tricarboxylate transporter receptor subunit TctC
MSKIKPHTWLLAVTIAAPSIAAEYPDRPIRIVVPFTAGSGTDLLARLIGPHLTQLWGQQVIVENRSGAGGTIGTGIVANATPDGHTLLMNSSAFAGAPSIYLKLPFDTIKDFTGVSLVAGNPLVLSVAPSVGAKTVKELIALAHKHPGKYTFGSAGVGSGSHYGAELFRFMAKMDTVHVPYRGTPESIMDTVAGRVTYATPPILAVLPLVREGRIIPLAVTTLQRAPLLPDVPTVDEAGLPGYEYDGWFGVIAPVKTPRPIVDKLSKEIRRIVQLPDAQDRIASLGGRSRFSTPEEFNKLIRTEVETRARVFAAAGIKPN